MVEERETEVVEEGEKEVEEEGGSDKQDAEEGESSHSCRCVSTFKLSSSGDADVTFSSAHYQNSSRHSNPPALCRLLGATC